MWHVVCVWVYFMYLVSERERNVFSLLLGYNQIPTDRNKPAQPNINAWDYSDVTSSQLKPLLIGWWCWWWWVESKESKKTFYNVASCFFNDLQKLFGLALFIIIRASFTNKTFFSPRLWKVLMKSFPAVFRAVKGWVLDLCISAHCSKKLASTNLFLASSDERRMLLETFFISSRSLLSIT